MKSKYKNWKATLIFGIVMAVIGFFLMSISKFAAVLFVILGLLLVFAGVTGKKKYKEELEEASQNAERARVAKENMERFAALRAEGAKQFAAELDAIPCVEVHKSDAPVKRKKEKYYPVLSNITVKTDINKLFPLVVVDVETTGLKPAGNDIIEVSAIKYNSPFVPESCFTTLCKPRNHIPEAASNVNHITDEMVMDAPFFSEIAESLSDYMKGCTFVGQFLEFDADFLHACGADLPEGKYFDTCDLARHTIKGLQNYKLETLCNHFNIYRDDAHRSLSDAYATALIFERLIDLKRNKA